MQHNCKGCVLFVPSSNVALCKQIKDEIIKYNTWKSKGLKSALKMGNMLINKRVEETIFSGPQDDDDQSKKKEYRMLPKHMYGVSMNR